MTSTATMDRKRMIVIENLGERMSDAYSTLKEMGDNATNPFEQRRLKNKAVAVLLDMNRWNELTQMAADDPSIDLLDRFVKDVTSAKTSPIAPASMAEGHALVLDYARV